MIQTERRNVAPVQTRSLLSEYFGGVDLTNSELNVDKSRSPNALNLIPKTVGKNEKRPAWKYHTFTTGSIPENAKINGYYEYELESGKYAFLHAGTKLYLWNFTANSLTEIQHKDGGIENPTAGTLTLNDAPSKIYGLEDKVFILDGKDIYVIEQLNPITNSYTFYTDGTNLTTTAPTGNHSLSWNAEPKITLSAPINLNNFYFSFSGKDVTPYWHSVQALYDGTEIGFISFSNSTYATYITTKISNLDMPVSSVLSVKISSNDTGSISGTATDPIKFTFTEFPMTATKLNTNYVKQLPLYSSVATKIYKNICSSYAPIVYIGKSNGDANSGTLLPVQNKIGVCRREKFYYTNVSLTQNTTFALSKTSSVGTTATMYLKTGADWLNIKNAVPCTVTTAGVVTYKGATITNLITDNIDNVEIEYYYYEPTQYKEIAKCTLQTLYGESGAVDRVFVSGNPSLKNYDWFSAINDGTYFPINNFSQVGSPNSPIIEYSRYNNSLVTYKRGELDNSNLFIREFQELDGEYFPFVVQTVNVEAPLSSKSISWLNGEQLHLSDNGIVALTPRDYTSELNTQQRGFFLKGNYQKGLLSETGLENAISCVHNNFYFLNVGSKLYILDGSQPVSSRDDRMSTKQYEGFVWDNVEASLMWSSEGILWFGTATGKLCKFDTQNTTNYTDGDGDIVKSYWETPFITGSNPFYRMSVTYIGGQLDAYSHTGVEVKARIYGIETNALIPHDSRCNFFDFGNFDFSQLNFSTDDTPRLFGKKVKKKKIDKIQLIFKNEKAQPFSLNKYYIEFTETGKFIK